MSSNTEASLITASVCLILVGGILSYAIRNSQPEQVSTVSVPIHIHEVSVECIETGQQPAFYTHFVSPFPMRF